MTEIERLADWDGVQWVLSEVRPVTHERLGQDAYMNSFVWHKDYPPPGARVIEQPLGVPEAGAAKKTTKRRTAAAKS